MTEEKLHIDDHEEQIKDVVMLAARILLEAGAEGTRTEETMNYIASHYGFVKNNSFVTNTVINFILHDQSYPRIYRIKERNTNLIKISKVNTVSRKLVRDELTLDEAYKRLEEIYVKTIAGALIGLSFLYLQDGIKIDILTVLFAGGIGILVTEMIKKRMRTQFIPEFFGGLSIALAVVAGHYFIPGGNLSVMLISSVMPIVPGVLITNAIQDLFGGHMMMFTTKSSEALVTSFAIGAGVSAVLIFA
ncbi:Uncharacterized membrane protein YjjP, DUF1212 family [Jeotgalicoccus aerolatus]|uniref:Uncharacterized membrane protein YjjP, DUF1212 family n=2 Tax=Jeotgalicoccus aerolatus TaxID=709510 RepID=A0A1G9BI85_9STAP|nr:Uncharacterized membrane protein YjjP, DUF1212 family [Jeotgalicoccus aerolatus]